MPPATSPIHMRHPPRRHSPADDEATSRTVGKGRKSSEKTEEETTPPSTIRRRVGRPRWKKPIDDDKADVDNAPTHYQDFEEDDSDDDIHPAGSKKNPKYYIVKNEKSGRPTEVFRTDRLHALRQGIFNKEDSDEEYCGPHGGMLKLHDRWREEWNYGIQVPVNCQNLPVFETAENDLPPLKIEPFTVPSKYIGIRPQTSSDGRHPLSPTKYVHPSSHEIVQLPERLLYQGDRMDEIWLEKANKMREHNTQQKLSMKQFLKIMGALEVQCYVKIHEELLAPLHMNSTLGVDDDDACDICGHKDIDEGDDILYCDNCNTCFHISCYGLDSVPKDGWNCMRCLLSGNNIPPCIMCPTIGGALKLTGPMADGQPRWCHVGCALWIPECKFADPEARERVIDIDRIPDERWQMKCTICDTRKGACIQCSFPTCKTAFHVACAIRSGYEMRIEPNHDDPDSDAIQMISLCNKHRSVTTLKLNESGEKAKLSSDEEVDEKENPLLRSLEARFFMYIDEDAIVSQLKEDRLAVSDVYEYWKLKRHHLGGKALIANPQDQILTGVPYNFSSFSNDNSMFNRLKNATTKIMHWYDKARNLATQVGKRERTKVQLVQKDIEIMTKIWDQLISQVPISERATSQLVENLKFTMPRSSILLAEEQEADFLLNVETPRSSTDSFDSPAISRRRHTTSPMKTPDKSPSNRRKTIVTLKEEPPDNDYEPASIITRHSSLVKINKPLSKIKNKILDEEVAAKNRKNSGRKPSRRANKIKRVVLSTDNETEVSDEVEEDNIDSDTDSSGIYHPSRVLRSPRINNFNGKSVSSIRKHRSAPTPAEKGPCKRLAKSPKRRTILQVKEEPSDIHVQSSDESSHRHSSSRYLPQPTSTGQSAERRLTRSIGPIFNLEHSPEAPAIKRSKIERPLGRKKTVQQDLIRLFNPEPPTLSPLPSSPIASRLRHVKEEPLDDYDWPPMPTLKKHGDESSEASIEYGGEYQRAAVKTSAKLSRNFSSISNFVENIRKEPVQLPDLSPPTSPRTLRSSPVKDSHPISSRKRPSSSYFP